jgi:protein-S-isoprenylcysteine O-methyltransferase Ste14
VIAAVTWALAALGAVGVVIVSRRSLRRPSSHGFARLFAFLAILALIPLNVPHWFERPWCARQLASWALLFGSIYPVVAGTLLLRRRGRPSTPGPGSDLLAFENTSALVTGGIYRYIRHPMYASLLCLTWGAALKSPTPLPVVLALVASAALAATATTEEAENLVRFGAAYRDYMRHTKRFVPFII